MPVPVSAAVGAVCALLLLASSTVLAQHQQQIEPSYLQQYYAQVAQAAGAQADATPIVEQTPAADAQQQYYVSPQAQQIRVKDAVAQQVRAQQQQQYVAPSVRQYLQQPQPKPQQSQSHVQYLQQPQLQPQQQIHYRPAPVPKQTLAVVPQRPRAQAYQQQPQDNQRLSKPEEAEEEEEYEQNPSYQFGFDVKDDEFTNYQNRKESREGNVIKGSYSVVDSDGFIRTVTYTADPKEGFKAQVVREPTDIVVKVPTQAPPIALSGHRAGQHQLHQQPQHQQHQQQQPQQQQYYQPQPQQQQQQQQYRAPQKQQQHQQASPQPHYQYE